MCCTDAHQLGTYLFNWQLTTLFAYICTQHDIFRYTKETNKYTIIVRKQQNQINIQPRSQGSLGKGRRGPWERG